MAAHLVRLKLAVLANGLRRSPWQVVAMVFGLLYALGAISAVLVGLGVLSMQDPELRRTVLVLGGGVLVLAWWVVPVLAFGLDATLDPDRLARFPVPRRSLVLGTGLAALVGVPGAATVVVATATAVSWWRSPGAVLAGLVGAALAVATCVAGSRALTTVLGPLAGARRFREAMTLLAFLPLILMGPLLAGVGHGIAGVADSLPAVADVVAWTPLGAAWALPADVVRGSWLALLGRLLVQVAAVVGLVLLWDRALAAALVRPLRGSGGRSRISGLGLFGRVPATPTGAVAARCLTYWVRDPRYASSVVVVPLLPVLFWFLGQDGPLMLALGPLAAFLLGWAVSADVAFDSTAFWTHVAAPLRGRQDRAGRAWAAGAVGLPATLAMTVVSLALSGRWDLTLPLLGASVGVLLTALGVASVASARLVYPVPLPGDSPFSTPQGGTAAAMLSQLVGSAVLLVLLLPTLGLAVAAVVTGSGPLGVLTAVAGVGLGSLLLVVGVRTGGDVYDRRAPELMQRLVALA